MKIRTGLYYFLFAVGIIQPVGYLIDSRIIRGIGAATAASPLPIVFSDAKGLETFASRFTLIATQRNGTRTSIAITPELYNRFEGPYNRRNVYGAAISYGPRLPKPVWKSVLHYGFCQPGPLAESLGLDKNLAVVEILLESKTAGRPAKWELEVACNR